MLPDDVNEVKRVFAHSFPPHLRRLMIYGQHGLSNYLRDVLNSPTLFPEFKFYVFKDSRGLGYAEFRLAGDQGFLSNIFIDAGLRGQGVGSQLIAHFLAEFPQVGSLGLDVFESNAGAVRLYQKLGFVKQNSRIWYVRPLAQPPETASTVSEKSDSEFAQGGLVSSVAMYERYGFTEYQTQRGVRFGRIGDNVLHCLQARDAENSEILIGVRRHFPQITEAFCISSTLLSPPWQQVDVSWRMSMNPQPTSKGAL